MSPENYPKTLAESRFLALLHFASFCEIPVHTCTYLYIHTWAAGRRAGDAPTTPAATPQQPNRVANIMMSRSLFTQDRLISRFQRWNGQNNGKKRWNLFFQKTKCAYCAKNDDANELPVAKSNQAFYGVAGSGWAQRDAHFYFSLLFNFISTSLASLS